MLRRNFVAGLAGLGALLSGCTTAPAEYQGADAGTVVVGLGMLGETKMESIRLIVQRVGAPAAFPSLSYQHRSMMGADKPDFQFDDRAERGVVLVRAMPPGDYVLSGFSLVWANNAFTPQKALAIRFTVKSGQATYLGNYQFTEVTGSNVWGMTVPEGGFFAVEDRAATELPLAQRKGLSPQMPVINATVDADRLNHPLLMSAAKRKRLAAAAGKAS